MGPTSGLLTNRGWTPWSLEDYLGLFPRAVSVLQKEGEGAHVRTLGKDPKSSGLHLKRDLGCFLQGGFISSHQPAESARSARVSRETGNGPGTVAVMLRGCFGNWCTQRTFQFTPMKWRRKTIF